MPEPSRPTRRRPVRGRPGGALAPVAMLLAAFVVASCDASTSSPPIDAPTPTAVPTDPGSTPEPGQPTQTETDWGVIWDAVPDAFPTFPGSSPTEPDEGPASAVLDVGDAEPTEVATFFQSNLESAGFSTFSLAGPREDGSYELESVGETTCRILTTITPRDGSTLVTILYGAGCPFD